MRMKASKKRVDNGLGVKGQGFISAAIDRLIHGQDATLTVVTAHTSTHTGVHQSTV